MNRTTETISLRSRPVLITSLVASLAAALGGCSATHTSRSNGNFETDGLASLSDQQISPEATTGMYTSETYQAEAAQVVLPEQWLSEAEWGTAEIEARRAGAEAEKLRAAAGSREAFAAGEAALTEAYGDTQSQLAHADMIAEVYDSRLTEQRSQIEARRHSFQAESHRREAFLAASISEWQAEVERMRSGAEASWNDAMARHEQLLAERFAVEVRGQATIDKMLQVAELTARRASDKVIALRTEAQSTTDTTGAQVSELNATIQSVREQTSARVSELRQHSESLRDETISIVSELMAEADALDTQDVHGEYGMALQEAQVSFETSLSEASDLRAMAIEKRMMSGAEVERRLAELAQSEQNTKAAYDEAIAHIGTTLADAISRIDVKRAEAVEIEKSARAAFVKAETDARVQAVIAESAHQRELAEQEFEKVRADARAEAAALQSKLYRQIAKELKAGKVTLSPEAEANEATPANNADSPGFADAPPKMPVVKPDRIAVFKTGLAEATKIRVQADASEASSYAQRDGEFAQFNAWLEQAGAKHESWHARIGAFGRQSDSEVAALLSKAESVVVSAEAAREKSFVVAESDKQSTMARIGALSAKAMATEKKNLARVEQLLARADTTARNGDSEVRTLAIRRDSTLRRGTARGRALLAEAAALEQSQGAVVSLMGSEIDSARRILSSELARLDQSGETFLAVAEANYEEQKVLAETFERISVANATELASAHMTAQKQATADVEYLHRMADANEISAGAEVGRMIADANTSLSLKEAENLAFRAEVESRERIALAAAGEQRAIADAAEHVVRSQFDSRIASTIASRDRAYADVYLDNFRGEARTRQAFADAARYEELASAALDRLNAAARSFGRTADENWDARLAMPAGFAQPADTDNLYRRASEKLNEGVFVNVEVD